MQSLEYFPSGVVFRSRDFERQPYRFTGKELISMHGLDWYDSKARMQGSQVLDFKSLDPLCEDYYGISPYVYCGGNPVNNVDPDGKDFWDVVKGIGVAISDNATLGAVNQRGTTAYNDASDYNLGQNIGDAISIIAGAGEAATGAGGAAAGVVVSSTGVGAVVGAPAAAEGAAMATHGTMMMFGAGKNLNDQKGRVAESSSGSKGRSNMKENGVPNSSLIQERNSNGKVTKYSTYDSNGKIIKEYRGEGKPHGNIERPNVKETQYNTNPKTGKVFQNKSKVREAYPNEIPK